jgi:hypothetical protein
MMLEEEARKKLNRYIMSTERVFKEMKVLPPADVDLKKALESNISLSKQYFVDSKHYLSKGNLITALVCIAYCEGLIDSCRILGWLRYEWKLK